MFLLTLGYGLVSYTQVSGLFINDASLHVQSNATLTILGDLEAEVNAEIYNAGSIFLRDDLINNTTNQLFNNQINGDFWLIGNNQNLGGVSPTSFYNLHFQGGLLTIKNFNQNAEVRNFLDINEQIMETNNFIVHLSNPAWNALNFSNGFVSSSLLGGYFARSTNTQEDYIFPVGQLNFFPNTRPVFVTPNSSNNAVFQVRLAPVGPGIDNSGVSASGALGPFDINAKQPSINLMNDAFYHNIFRSSGNTNADIAIYYNSSDGDFETVAQWMNNEHRDAFFTIEADNFFNLDRVAFKNAVNNFNDDVFTLVNLNLDIVIPNGVSANGDGLNDFLIIDNIEYYPNNSLSIFNRWGDLVFNAAPYENNWQGQSNVRGVIGGDQLIPGTYFYVFKLQENATPIKGYIELKR